MDVTSIFFKDEFPRQKKQKLQDSQRVYFQLYLKHLNKLFSMQEGGCMVHLDSRKQHSKQHI